MGVMLMLLQLLVCNLFFDVICFVPWIRQFSFEKHNLCRFFDVAATVVETSLGRTGPC